MTGPARRYPVKPALGLAVAACLLWASSRLTWVRVHSFDGLGDSRVDGLTGGTWGAATTPLALLLVAAIAAAFAVRGVALRVLGVLVMLAAAGAAIPAVSLLSGGATDSYAGELAELPGRAAVTGVETYALPAVLALLGSVAALVAGLLLVRKQGAGAGLSSKYANPAERRAEATRLIADSEPDATPEPMSERTLWDALDAGADPTATGEGDPGTPR